MRFIQRMALVLFTIVTLPASGLDAPGEPKSRDPQDYGSFEVHRAFAFHDPASARTEPGLYLMRIRPTSDTTRVLTRTPDGRNVVLTSTIDVRTGRMTTEFTDDATGWGARTVIETGVTARNLFMFYREYPELHPVEAGTEVPVRFETSDGFTFETSIPAHESISERQNLVIEKISATGRLTELSDSVPPELRAAILFLDASLSPDVWPDDEGQGLAYGVRGAMAIVGGALRYSPPSGQAPDVEPWPMVVGPLEKGHGPWSVEELELLSGFRTVSPASFLPPEPGERRGGGDESERLERPGS